jgi:hypothetical protein
MVAEGNNIFAEIAAEKEKLAAEEADEIAAAEKTGASVQLIKAKYAKLEKDLDDKTLAERLRLAGEFFGNVATIAGKQSALGKAAAVAETTINTYASATASYKALASIPVVGPALGFAAAAAAVVAGLANVKEIVSVDTTAKGYEVGGYTSSGAKYQPAGIVHAGEWVANADMVASPTYGPVIQSLEYARVNGTPQFINGGNVGSVSSTGAAGSSSTVFGSNARLEALIAENIRVNKMLLQKGVKTVWGYNDVDNVRKGLNKIDDIERSVTR